MTIKQATYRVWQKARRLMRERITKLTGTAIILMIVIGLPNLFGYLMFWVNVMKWMGHRLNWLQSTPGKWIIVGTALVAIWADQRRVTRRLHRRSYDLNTLKGRTLAFCDELRDFHKELGPEPEITYKSGMDSKQFNIANMASASREQKMHHGFHLRLSDRALHLFHEHGMEMREDWQLGNALRGRVDSDEKLTDIIDRFVKLTEMMD